MAPPSSGLRTLIPVRCKNNPNNELPIEHVGLLSFLWYGWLDKFMFRAWRRDTVHEQEMWACPDVDSAKWNDGQLERLWRADIATNTRQDASLMGVCMRFARKRHILAVVLMVLAFVVLVLCQGYVYMSLLSSLARPGEAEGMDYGYAALLFVCQLAYTILFMAVFAVTHVAAGRIRSGLLSIVYKHLLHRVSPSVGNEKTGYLMTLFATDSQRIFDGVSMFPMLLAPPILTIGATIYACYLLGPFALIGFVVVLLIIPLNGVVAGSLMKLKKLALEQTDKRMRTTTEALQHMEFVKMSTLEEPITRRVGETRAAEMKRMFWSNFTVTIAMMTSTTVVTLATIVTLIIYAYTGHSLTFVQAFTYVVLYSGVTSQLDLAVMSLKSVMEFKVAVTRCQAILNIAECGLSTNSHPASSAAHLNNYAVLLNNVTMSLPVVDLPDPEDPTDQPPNATEEEERLEPEETQARNRGGGGWEMDIADGSMMEMGMIDETRMDGGSVTMQPENNDEASMRRMDGTRMDNLHEAEEEEETEDPPTASETDPLAGTPGPSAASTVTLQSRDASDGKEETKTLLLQNIHLSIKRGTHVGIAGKNGSGKSSLLKTILGDLKNESGTMAVMGEVAYVPQVAWIDGTTVRENICFHTQYDKFKYDQIITVCALNDDLQAFPDRDLTVLGERGSTLSGGQKQRISLARALYSDADIYLLDDPLSALDPEVAGVVFGLAIKEHLRQKTVLLATNNSEHLGSCDHVVLMDGGHIVQQGPPHELMKGEDNNGNSPPLGAQGGATVLEVQNNTNTSNNFMDLFSSLDPVAKPQKLYEQNNNAASKNIVDEVTALLCKVEEQREEGAVSKAAYTTYINNAGGLCALGFVIFLTLLSEGGKAFTVWWLGEWLSKGSGGTMVIEGNTTYLSDDISVNPDLQFYTSIYGVSLLATVAVYMFRSLLVVKVMMRAASYIHNAFFDAVIHTEMSFFHDTPLGRLVNRFSKDQDELDSGLPPMIDTTLKNSVAILLYLILIGIFVPWFLIAALIMMVIFFGVYNVFRVGARESRRLYNVAMSPLLNHVNQTIHGLPCIRAFKKMDIYYDKFCEILDYTTTTYLTYTFVQRWINVRLSVITAAATCATAMFLIYHKQTVKPEYAAVALVYAVQLSSLLQFLVRCAVECETRFTSVERIAKCTKDLKKEDLEEYKDEPAATWPNGHLDIQCFSMRHRTHLPLALENIVCDIRRAGKVAVVGRTGAGKSSLAAALFRICEADGGCIMLDQHDISRVSLHRLRSGISIVPQDPVLFSGTVRQNLDPFNKKDDDEILTTLGRLGINDIWDMEPKQKLDMTVGKDGENLSQGVKQLLCLARATLEFNNLIIMDEATSAMDERTSDTIKLAINKEFQKATVLVITHNLDMVQQCESVIVIKEGKLVEYDKPAKLWANESSEFYRLMSPTVPSGVNPDKIFETPNNPDSPSSPSSDEAAAHSPESASLNLSIHGTSGSPGSSGTDPENQSNNIAGAKAAASSSSTSAPSPNGLSRGNRKAPLATVEHISEHELNTSSSGSASGTEVQVHSPSNGKSTHDKAPLFEEV